MALLVDGRIARRPLKLRRRAAGLQQAISEIRKSISESKTPAGMPTGVKVTLSDLAAPKIPDALFAATRQRSWQLAYPGKRGVDLP
jgi:ribosomal protein L5